MIRKVGSNNLIQQSQLTESEKTTSKEPQPAVPAPEQPVSTPAKLATAAEQRFTSSTQGTLIRTALESKLRVDVGKEGSASSSGADKVTNPDLVGMGVTDPVESDPAFQQLPAETKEHIRADLRNAPDENAKANIRKLATDPSFDSVSVQSQKTALEALADRPSSDAVLKGVRRTCSDMVSLENSADFQNLPPNTQEALRGHMFRNSDRDNVRDSLIFFAHNPDFAKMSSDNQQRMLGAFLTNPTEQNSSHMSSIIGSPSFQNMDEAMQQQVLVLASKNSRDEQGMQSIEKLLRDSSFEQISPASQKEALEAMSFEPSKHVDQVRRTCSDMVSLENSADFQNLPPNTQDALRGHMFRNSDRDNVRDSLIFFAHNPDFAKMSSDNQQRMLGAFLTNPTEQNSSHMSSIIGSPSFQNMDEAMQQQVLVLASKNSRDEQGMQSIEKLLRDSSFEQISPASQKEALEAMSFEPSKHVDQVRRTCSDMVSLENSADFQNLPPNTQDALRGHMFRNSDRDNVRDSLIFFAHNPDFAKMSSDNQQRMLGAFLTNPTEQNSSHMSSIIGSPSFQNMDEAMQQQVLILASKNSADEKRMQGLADLLRDAQFVNSSSGDQYNQLIRTFGRHDPDLEI